MKNLRSYVLGSGALFLAALALPMGASCSSGQAPATGDAGGSGGTHGSGGTTGSGHEGGGGISCGTGCYAPAGCSYQVAPPEDTNRMLGYTNFSVDTPSGSAGAPIRVRLGLGGGTTMGQPGYADPTTSAVLTWETAAADTNAKVQMGTSMTSLTDVHQGYSWTTAAGLSTSANFHEVHVCGLKAGTTYYYQVGGGAAGREAWSATQSFTTPPATGTVKVAFYGDARDSSTVWQTVHQHVKAQSVDLHVSSGDIVYVGPIEAQWSMWLDAIWKDPTGSGFLTLGETLMVPIAGNHEMESPDFYANFSLPGTGDWAETYASFNVGNAHIVVFDDQPVSMASSQTSLAGEALAQVTWLKADLAAADKDRTAHPFIIFVSHRGMFSTSDHATDSDVLLVRAVLAPIFDTYHVDLVVNGHDHEYERSHPLNANASDPSKTPVIQTDPTKGTTYVINAGAGASSYAINSSPQPYSAFQWAFDAPTQYIGCYAIVELSGKTLKWTEYGVKGAASSDDMVESFMLSH